MSHRFLLSGLLVSLLAGCGATSGTSDRYMRRDVENLALRLRHLEDRISELEDSLGGLASRTFNAASAPAFDDEYQSPSLPLVSTVSGSLAASTAEDYGEGKTFTHMVQSALNKAGYDAGPVDGKMGRKTAAALKSFQRAHDLKVTGSTTRATWRLLSKYLSK